MSFYRAALRVAPLAAGLLLSSSTASASIILDNFRIAQTVTVYDPITGHTATSSVADPALLGGDREFFVERSTSFEANDEDVRLRSAPALDPTKPGSLSLATSDQNKGRGMVTYDGTSGLDSATNTFLGHPDQFLLDETAAFDTDFSNHYKFTVIASSDQGLPLTITVYNADGSNWARQTITIPSGGTPQTLDFYFSTFISNSGGPEALPLIFSKVGAITIALGHSNINTGPISVDATMRLLEVTQIPEPATLALVGLALVGASALSRKRSNA